MDLSLLGVTRWKVLTPLRFLVFVRAAQSMGEWPGERRTLPRAFGTAMAPFGLSPPFTRCCLFCGGPRLGRGPLEGTRRDAAELRGGTGTGRGGGGMRFAGGLAGGASVPFGDFEAEEVRCGLAIAGDDGGTTSDGVWLSRVSS